jgi:hypothetical protein
VKVNVYSRRAELEIQVPLILADPILHDVIPGLIEAGDARIPAGGAASTEQTRRHKSADTMHNRIWNMVFKSTVAPPERKRVSAAGEPLLAD